MRRSSFCTLPALFLAAITVTVLPRAAQAEMGRWVFGEEAKVRLVAAAPRTDGLVPAAIEIVMTPGWKTYWRTPGAGGLAPRFDFSRSDNVRAATVSYPPPERETDGFSASNVYHDRVVLPVTVERTDSQLPGRLDLQLMIGVCLDICIPVMLEAAIDLPADLVDPRADEIVAAAEARLPGAAEAGRFAVETVTRTGGTDTFPEFDVTVAAPDPATAAVFVEGPAGWWPAPPEELWRDDRSLVYRIVFDRLGLKTAPTGADLVFTVVSGGAAVEQRLTLD